MKPVWQKISTVPKDREVLLWCDDFMVIAEWSNDATDRSHRWMSADGNTYHNEIFTHWAERPLTPNG